MPSRLTFCGVRRVARGSGDAHHVTRAIGQARPLIRAAARSQTGPRQLPRTQPPPCVGRLHWVPGRTAATARLYRRPSPSRRCPARRPRPATAPTRNPSSPTPPPGFYLHISATPPHSPSTHISGVLVRPRREQRRHCLRGAAAGCGVQGDFALRSATAGFWSETPPPAGLSGSLEGWKRGSPKKQNGRLTIEISITFVQVVTKHHLRARLVKRV